MKSSHEFLIDINGADRDISLLSMLHVAPDPSSFCTIIFDKITDSINQTFNTTKLSIGNLVEDKLGH